MNEVTSSLPHLLFVPSHAQAGGENLLSSLDKVSKRYKSIPNDIARKNALVRRVLLEGNRYLIESFVNYSVTTPQQKEKEASLLHEGKPKNYGTFQ